MTNKKVRINMNHSEFNKLLNEIVIRTTNVLATKSAEYSTDTDKLHNFKRAGKMLQCSPEKALVGMWTKHVISILDIVDGNTAKSYDEYIKTVEEKITDAINYLILLEALIKE